MTKRDREALEDARWALDLIEEQASRGTNRGGSAMVMVVGRERVQRLLGALASTRHALTLARRGAEMERVRGAWLDRDGNVRLATENTDPPHGSRPLYAGPEGEEGDHDDV